MFAVSLGTHNNWQTSFHDDAAKAVEAYNEFSPYHHIAFLYGKGKDGKWEAIFTTGDSAPLNREAVELLSASLLSLDLCSSTRRQS